MKRREAKRLMKVPLEQVASYILYDRADVGNGVSHETEQK
jgi:hypothetical protein